MPDTTQEQAPARMSWKDGEDFACFLEGLEGSTAEGMGFDMTVAHTNKGFSTHPCGTAMCIGGWCAMALRPYDRSRLYVGEAAAIVLGIDHEVAQELCYPDIELLIDHRASQSEAPVFYDLITPKQAAQAVRNALEYGDPGWDGILEEVRASMRPQLQNA